MERRLYRVEEKLRSFRTMASTGRRALSIITQKGSIKTTASFRDTCFYQMMAIASLSAMTSFPRCFSW